MTDEMRENIKTTVRSKFAFYADELPAKEAYLRCYAFAHGVQVGSQDADLCNFTNALLNEYRQKLAETSLWG